MQHFHARSELGKPCWVDYSVFTRNLSSGCNIFTQPTTHTHTHTHTHSRSGGGESSLCIDLCMRLTVDKAFPCNWAPVNGSFPSCSCLASVSALSPVSDVPSVLVSSHSSDCQKNASSFRHACLVCHQFLLAA